MDSEENIIEGEVVKNNEEGDSLWFMSAIKGDLEYLENNKYLAGSRGENNRTALMYAAEAGNLVCVDFLCTLEEEIGKQDSGGYTAMMYAAKNGYLDCVALLVEEENNIINNDNKRAINIALENNQFECANLLEKYEYLDNDDGSTDQNDDSNDERNLIKENKKLKKQEQIIKKANKDVDKVLSIEKNVEK